MKKLTLKEEEIMDILWDNGPMFIREMLAFYKEPKPHYNTVATLVKLLVEKGFVCYRPLGNTYQYEAKITRKQYHGSALSDITILRQLLYQGGFAVHRRSENGSGRA